MKLRQPSLGTESCDLLSVLDELNSDTLTDSRVRLLSLNTNLLKNNSLCVRCSSEGISLPSCSQVSLLVIFVSPNLVSPVLHVFTGGSDSSWLTHLCFSCRSESSNICLV